MAFYVCRWIPPASILVIQFLARRLHECINGLDSECHASGAARSSQSVTNLSPVHPYQSHQTLPRSISFSSPETVRSLSRWIRHDGLSLLFASQIHLPITLIFRVFKYSKLRHNYKISTRSHMARLESVLFMVQPLLC